MATGSYSFDATYNGDSNYGAGSSSCEPLAVGQAGATTATTVFDASGHAAWSGTETTGASAYDTTTVTPINGIQPTGTVTYSFFANGTCLGTATSTDTVSLVGGIVPDSSTEGPLATGSYSFDATYNGDSNYGAGSSSCEPFAVGQAGATIATTVFDAAGHAAWSGTEVTGASAYDTSTVSGVSGFTPTGTVTYSFFANGTCTGSAISTQTVSLVGGIVPDSSTVGPLAAGSYSFDATYNGDSNYPVLPSSCEPFTITKAMPSTGTTVFDAAGHAAWSGTEVTGASAYDTSTVSGVSGFTPTGTVTYSFFANGTCTGSAISTQTVSLVGGIVPDSSTVGPLAAGSYSFDATYNGDSNYTSPPANSCEPFAVRQSGATTATTVFDGASNTAWSGTETTGASAYDTATVSAQRCERLHTDRDSLVRLLLERSVPGHSDLHSDGDDEWWPRLRERDVYRFGDLNSDGLPGRWDRPGLFDRGPFGGRVVLLRRHLQRRLELPRAPQQL